MTGPTENDTVHCEDCSATFDGVGESLLHRERGECPALPTPDHIQAREKNEDPCVRCGTTDKLPHPALCLTCKNTCIVCDQKRIRLHRHHVSYLHEFTIRVCPSCHRKLHSRDGSHDALAPIFTRSEAEWIDEFDY